MEKLSFKVQEYEGPLDLILQLLAKHKLNIYDIEISSLLTQYMQVIDAMRADHLEIASEFLEMASYLVYIKSAMLLPRHEEEKEDPRRELTGRLLEYQACQYAARLLRERECGADRFVRVPMELETDAAYARAHDRAELLRAYFGALGRGKRRLPPPSAAFSGIVARRMVSVGSRIAFVLKNLYRFTSMSLYSLFEQSEDRPEMVATFLAVLELIKDQRVRVRDDQQSVEMIRSALPPSPEDETRYVQSFAE